MSDGWQDRVIGISQACFAVALLPSIVGPDKPALFTCVLTTGLLLGNTLSLGSLGMRLSFWCGLASTGGWAALTLQQMAAEIAR